MVEQILVGVVGSQAYGLAHADSDIDRLGVYRASTTDILGLTAVQETMVTKDELGDLTIHELGKFFKLCLNCNPTVMELLWLDDYLIQTFNGARLVGVRSAFLSAKAVDSYMGYALQQATRLKNRGGTFDPDLRKRTEKHGRHCWRFMLQGQQLIETGELQVRLSDKNVIACREAGLLAAEDPEGYYNMVKSRVDAIKSAGHGVLPEKPDTHLLNQVLVNIRMVG